MKKIITEEMIEDACIQSLSKGNYYNFINADINAQKVFSSLNVLDTVDDGTGRSNVQEAILPRVLYDSLKELNPSIPEYFFKQIVEDFKFPFSDKELSTTNYDNYSLLKMVSKSPLRKMVKRNIKRLNL